jgi:AcrR family transcriptional regulator/DNA-binding MarR family transcriptional regulator
MTGDRHVRFRESRRVKTPPATQPGRERAPSEGTEPEAVRRAATNGLGREQVAEIQRARILGAMAEVTVELGAGNVTVSHVVARSGVSRRTFYELFQDREDCFLAALDGAVERIATRVGPVFAVPGRWRERIRASLTALLEFLDFEPVLGRLVIVETLGAGAVVLERRSLALAQMIAAVDGGRGESKRGGPLPLTAEGVVGAVFSVVHTRMLQREPAPLIGLVGPLMSMIVLPYLGSAAARRELELPIPKSRRDGTSSTGNPLKDLEMRLTYRTVRVLMAIGTQPGVSNRRVADASGVTDQGQISKLLARLEHLGLIENSGFGQAKGESNSWCLTPRGKELEQAISAQTERH